MSEDRLGATCRAREAFYRTLGDVSADVWAPLVNPTFMGGPTWPALRQGWRTIARGGSTAVVSDGLSDPFDDEPGPNAGFGVEVLVETPDPVGPNVPAGWLFHLAYQVAQNAAHHGGFREAVERYGVFTMEVAADGHLTTHQTEEGRVGLLLGPAAPDLPVGADLPGGRLRLIPAKLLTAAELGYAVGHGQAGRDRLWSLFEQDRTYHRSSAGRASAV